MIVYLLTVVLRSRWSTKWKVLPLFVLNCLSLPVYYLLEE